MILSWRPFLDKSMALIFKLFIFFVHIYYIYIYGVRILFKFAFNLHGVVIIFHGVYWLMVDLAWQIDPPWKIGLVGLRICQMLLLLFIS